MISITILMLALILLSGNLLMEEKPQKGGKNK